MIDLEAMNRDPWTNWPVNKQDLMQLAMALKEMEAVVAAQHEVIVLMRESLAEIIRTDVTIIGAANRMKTTAQIAVNKL